MKKDRFQENKWFDRIEKGKIFLDGLGEFPKRLIIREHDRIHEYRIIKTKYGKFMLSK